MLNNSTATLTDDRGLVPVAVKALQSLPHISFDLYVWPEKSSRPRLYRQKDVPLGAAEFLQLLDENVTTLYARSSEAQQYSECLRSHILADETISAADRYCILKDATRDVLMASMKQKDVDSVVRATRGFGEDLVKLVCDRKNIFNSLLSVMMHDYSTFTHITNVCTYCVMLAEAVGIRDEASLIQIAQGALLHDIGKIHIPAATLNKATRLTTSEEELIRQHPLRGFRDLCLRPDIQWAQLMMAYQHHERYDGGGYPVGLVGKEIHEWARVCSVTDVYDSLTRDRAYRKGADPKDVLEYMDRESGRSFDEEICQCWIAMLKQCPR